jgi:hypothetical protein
MKINQRRDMKADRAAMREAKALDPLEGAAGPGFIGDGLDPAYDRCVPAQYRGYTPIRKAPKRRGRQA